MGSFVENVNKIASLTPANVGDLNLIVQNIVNINSVATNIVPNLAEILQADNNAVIATTKASEANTYQNKAYNYSMDTLASKNSAESARDLAITKAQEAVVSASNAASSAVIANAYANINYGGFSINDGELIVTYNNLATSVPSLVDGELILTY